MSAPTNQEVYDLITHEFSQQTNNNTGKDLEIIVDWIMPRDDYHWDNYQSAILEVAELWITTYNKRPHARWLAKRASIRENWLTIYMAYVGEPAMAPFPYAIKRLTKD